jgi:hypothetical protein
MSLFIELHLTFAFAVTIHAHLLHQVSSADIRGARHGAIAQM